MTSQIYAQGNLNMYKKIILMLLLFLFKNSYADLIGDTNNDGYNDTISIVGNYVKIKDGKIPNSSPRTYYVDTGATLSSLSQLDSDNALEVVVTRKQQNEIIVIDDSVGKSPTTYRVSRNGATGSQPYDIKFISNLNNIAGDEIVVLFPGDTNLWIIQHQNTSVKNQLITSNPSNIYTVDTDGITGNELVLFYASLGSVTIVHSVRTPAVVSYHQNYGTASTRALFYGSVDTDGRTGNEIILTDPQTTYNPNIYLITEDDTSGGYGRENTYKPYGGFTIMSTLKNRDALPGIDICIKTATPNPTYYSYLNTNSGKFTSTQNCN